MESQAININELGEEFMGKVIRLNSLRPNRFYSLLKEQPELIRGIVEFVIEEKDVRSAAKLIGQGVLRGHFRRVPGHKEEGFSSPENSELAISIGLPYVILSLRAVYKQFVLRYESNQGGSFNSSEPNPEADRLVSYLF